MVALGIAAGLSIHMTLAVGGLAIVFEQSPMLRHGVAWLAAAYLGWLSFCLLRAALKPAAPASTGEEIVLPRQRNSFLRGFICNLLNPKVVIFLASISAPFLKGQHPSWWPFVLWAVVVFQGGLLWALWARLLQWGPLRSRYERAARWIDGAFGVALAALAVTVVATS
jgi:threonine/homoserine/homoserine lactone efflux protein